MYNKIILSFTDKHSLIFFPLLLFIYLHLLGALRCENHKIAEKSQMHKIDETAKNPELKTRLIKSIEIYRAAIGALHSRHLTTDVLGVKAGEIQIQIKLSRIKDDKCQNAGHR